MSRLIALGLVLAVLASSRDAGADGAFGSEGDGEEAPPSAPDSHEPAPSTRPTTTTRPVVGLRVEGGYAPRTLLSLPVTGADAGLAIGAQPSRHIAIWGTTRLFLGSTESGLDVVSFRAGGDVEAVFDRFRIGSGLHLLVLGVSRATRDNTILTWGPATFASARFDVIQSEGFALFARASLDVGIEVSSGSLFWGPTLGGGVDFDLGGGSRASMK